MRPACMEKHEFKCRDLSKLIAFWRSRTNRIPAQGKKSKTNKKKPWLFRTLKVPLHRTLSMLFKTTGPLQRKVCPSRPWWVMTTQVDTEKKICISWWIKTYSSFRNLGIIRILIQRNRNWFVNRTLLCKDEVFDWDFDGKSQACSYRRREVWF